MSLHKSGFFVEVGPIQPGWWVICQHAWQYFHDYEAANTYLQEHLRQELNCMPTMVEL